LVTNETTQIVHFIVHFHSKSSHLAYSRLDAQFVVMPVGLLEAGVLSISLQLWLNGSSWFSAHRLSLPSAYSTLSYKAIWVPLKMRIGLGYIALQRGTLWHTLNLTMFPFFCHGIR